MKNCFLLHCFCRNSTLTKYRAKYNDGCGSSSLVCCIRNITSAHTILPIRLTFLPFRAQVARSTPDNFVLSNYTFRSPGVKPLDAPLTLAGDLDWPGDACSTLRKGKSRPRKGPKVASVRGTNEGARDPAAGLDRITAPFVLTRGVSKGPAPACLCLPGPGSARREYLRRAWTPASPFGMHLPPPSSRRRDDDPQISLMRLLAGGVAGRPAGQPIMHTLFVRPMQKRTLFRCGPSL